MTNEYEPELGQMFFGNKWNDVECPDFITAGFLYLEQEIEMVEWNIRQESYESPLGGGFDEYINKVFQVRPYYWGDDEKISRLPNFKCGKFEVRWYKHMGRGMSMNKDIDANEFFNIINKCVKYLRGKDMLLKKKRGFI